MVPKLQTLRALAGQLEIAFPDDALRTIIEEYTREAGLRNLEREIGSCCRKVAVRIASGKTKPVKMTPELVRELLGVPKFRNDEALARDEVGAATASAMTSRPGIWRSTIACSTTICSALAAVWICANTMAAGLVMTITNCNRWVTCRPNSTASSPRCDASARVPTSASA